jgi:O-antigen/teichoic acid export membrane protein
MSLKTKAHSAIRWTSFSSLGCAMLQFSQMSILARCLDKADFGRMALVMAVINFLGIFSDMGISNALIHHHHITKSQLSTLYWLNVGTSLLLVLGVFFTSPAIAIIYNDPSLHSLLSVAALTLLVNSLSQQVRVLAQKALRFSLLAKVELISAIIGFFFAIASAIFHFGAYSFIIGNLGAALAGALLAWVWLTDDWCPVFRIEIDEIPRFLKYGIYMLGNALANAFNLQADVLLGARILGPEMVGLYSVPKTLSLRIAQIVNPIVTRVGLPIMALAQADEDLLKRIYLQTIRFTASINFPVYVALAIFSPEVVYIALGAHWYKSSMLLQVLAVWALLRSIVNPVGSLVMAVGKPHLECVWNCALLLVVWPVVWFGATYGVLGIAISLSILQALLLLPAWYFLIRPLCGATIKEYSQQVAAPFALSITAGVFSYIVSAQFTMPIARLGVGLVVGFAAYMSLSLLFNKRWVAEISQLISKRKSLSAT